MRSDFLELLRCPFCGDKLQVEEDSAIERCDDRLLHGILYCQCCAYPVVAGIPYLRTGAAAKAGLDALHRGDREQALFFLLGLDEGRREEFRELLNHPATLTFRRALQILSSDAEGCYFLYRFSDPTFVVSEALLRALDQKLCDVPGLALDVGGGAGHLTRCLASLTCADTVVLLDLEFWKLWLAKQFIVTGCQAVCGDANAPLPFDRGIFSLVFCSDALNYVWQRRLAVTEMIRLLNARGTLLLTHLHNALCENASPGLPLTPAGYRHLFEGISPRLYPESAAFDAALTGHPLELRVDGDDLALQSAPSLCAIATRRQDLFDRYLLPEAQPLRQPSVNPIYELESGGPPQVFTLKFPSADYETEFAACKRYLPPRVELSERQLRLLELGRWDDTLADLARRRLLLELPERYR